METEKSYAPRAGSKIALAIEAMADGPVFVAELAKVMNLAPNDVPTRLHCAVQNNLVMKVVDTLGATHFMRAADPIPEGFKRPDGVNYNTADPFGLVGRRKGDAPAAPVEQPAARTERALVAPIRPRGVKPAAKPADAFLAALFSTGELLIQVGDDQVMLSQDHQHQLRQYCARFEKDEV